MRCHINTIACGLFVALLGLEHGQAHYLRTQGKRLFATGGVCLSSSPASVNVPPPPLFPTNPLNRLPHHSPPTDKGIAQQGSNTNDDHHSRRLRTRALATPLGRDWTFHEGAKDEEAAAALTEQDKQDPLASAPDDKMTPMMTPPVRHGRGYKGKDAVAEDDKGRTLMGHGWALEGGAKDAVTQAEEEEEEDKAATPVGRGYAFGEKKEEEEEAGGDKGTTPVGHGWVYGEKEAVAAPAAATPVEEDKGRTPMGHGWALEDGAKDTVDAAPAEKEEEDKAATPVGRGYALGEKVSTPLGHGWAMGEKDAKDVAFP